MVNYYIHILYIKMCHDDDISYEFQYTYIVINLEQTELTYRLEMKC